jgi:CDP-glucose 4,6-dehydratase
MQLFLSRDSPIRGGHDPYNSSKAAVEVATASWRNPFFGGNNNIRLATARAGNPIGYGYWSKDELIPDMVRYLSVGEVILDRNCNALRLWQHLLAPLTDT